MSLAARTRCSLVVVALLAALEANGQTPPSNSAAQPAAPSEAPVRLPAEVTTRHTLELPTRSLGFRATAGAIRLTDDKSAPRVDLAFVAYILNDAEPRNRPVTFAFNGGPGFASAWLNVGAVGPWRIPLSGDATSPSASPDPRPNAETWLDFTDLVFIDPAGTGYSLVRAGHDERRQLWSVEGDISYLAEAIRHWLDRFDRNVSPKYILGESYGGFRAPRLARALARSQGTGISGLILMSPALDVSGRSRAFDPFTYVTRLPSMAAAARAARGPVAREQLADVERYAATEYLVDLTRGESDSDAVARRSARVAEFIGLGLEVVKRYHGQIELPSPVDQAEALLFAARRLVVELAGFLRGRGAGVSRLRCDLVHEDAQPTSIVLGLSCTRQIEHIMNVLRERLGREWLPGRVEAIRLISEEIAPLAAKEGDFFPVPSKDREAGAQLIERLRARLGEDAVHALALRADHRPERAWEATPTIPDATSSPKRDDGLLPSRPLWLLPAPRPLGADPAAAQLKLLSGPERIETGWWDGSDVGRDYFVGRNASGEGLWLYRDRGGEWFVHGVFA